MTDHSVLPPSHAGVLVEIGAAAIAATPPKLLGEFLGEIKRLSPEDVARILAYQKERGLLFGEAAVALGLVSQEDVLRALAQQFRYTVADEPERLQRPDLIVLNTPFSPQAEAFRAIRSHYLQHERNQDARRPLAVLSHDAADGKSFFCANLAATLAQLSGKVLVIDANLRTPRQHAIFGVQHAQGLSSVLAGRGVRGVIQPVSGVDGLFILPAGAEPPNPLELIEGPTFRLLLKEVTKHFDHVLVDTPAHCIGMDAMVTAARSGAALVVSRRHANKIESLRALTEDLAAAQVETVGVVINDYQER